MEKEESKSGNLNTSVGEKHIAVETYAEDMAKLIEDDRGGLIKKIIHGAEENEKEKINFSPESRKNKLFMLVGVLLVLSASITLSFFFFRNNIGTVAVEEQFTPLIFNDASTFIEIKDLNKDQITQIVLNKINTTQVKIGGVEGVYLTENKKIIGLRRMLSLIKSSLVLDGDTRLISDNFLMGVVNGQTKDFFILIKVRDFTDIFESLRTWEGKMFSDLHGFFGVGISSATKDLLTADFQDSVVQNKNARVLYDTDGNTIMMYVFADDNSVVITNSKESAREIMLRLASGQIKQ